MGASNVRNCTMNYIIQFSAATWKLSLSLMLLLLPLALSHLDNPTDILSVSCSHSSIKNGSAWQGNLKGVPSSLVENVNKTGYTISWHGENGDKVYGLAQCRGDLNAFACRACVSNATKTLSYVCEGSGSINLNGCFVKYDTSDFYSKLDTPFPNYCGRNRTSTDGWGLDPSTTSLLIKLTDDAVSSDVAFSTVNGSGIYGLAQCWRDLNTSLCRKCLENGKEMLALCLNESEGLGFYENCMIKYETYKFYGEYAGLLSSLKSASSTSTNQAPIPASGPSRATNEAIKRHTTRSLVLRLGIAGVVIIVFMFTVFVIWKRKVTRPFYKKSLPGIYTIWKGGCHKETIFQ